MGTILDKAVSVAVREVWTNPQEDRRITFRPTVFSKRSGAIGLVELPWDTFVLPDQTNRYLVLQLGQLPPSAYGINTKINNWTKVADVIKDNEMHLQIHTNARMMFLGDAYVKVMNDRSVLFALRHDSNKELIELNKEILVRFYSNAWLSTTEGTKNAGVDTQSLLVKTIPEASVFLTKMRNDRLVPGNMLIYQNGNYVSDLHIKDISVGDRLEYTIDYSGSGFFDVNLEDLRAFDSTIDAKRKYIIPQPNNGLDLPMPSGDIEIYLCQRKLNKNGDLVSEGVYYSNVDESNVRSLTHRDWSIETLRTHNLTNEQTINFTDPHIRVFLRKASWSEKVIEDGNFVKDLYILDQETRADVMSTASSPVEEWKAANLESCPYTRWMELRNTDLSTKNLANVYSFHGLNTMMSRPTIEGDLVILPPIMEFGGLVMFYNIQGIMKLMVTVDSMASITLPPSMMYVECYPGKKAAKASDLETASSQENDPIDRYAQELFYRDVTGTWKIAEEGKDFVHDFANNTVTWTPLNVANIKGKRLAGRYFLDTVVLRDRDVGKRLPIFGTSLPPNSGLELGKLKLWLNGRPLIRDLEFVVEYPYFRLMSRELYSETSFALTVLFSGSSRDNIKPSIGFVKHRVLNYGKGFDISFNRDKDIIIGGHLACRDDVVYNEYPNNGVMNGRFKNGLPYSIEYPDSNIDNATVLQLTNGKSAAVALDKTIENYMGTIYPEPVTGDVNYIDGKYALMSPFMGSLLEDMLSGKLVVNYTDPSSGYVSRVCADYIYLLGNDPINNPEIEWDFIDLHPTGRVDAVEVSRGIYSFLQKANSIYMSNKCNLNTYLRVTS